MPTYPNVPDLPGVPSIPRDPSGSSVNDTTTPDTTSAAAARTVPAKWGIYTASGAIVLESDSFVQMGFGKEYVMPTYPIEEGSFETYNKVERPFIGTVVISRGGTEAQRKTFLSALEALVASLDLYTLVTPERSYSSVSFGRLEYDRGPDRGATLIVAELRFQEIRQTATAEFVYTTEALGQQLSGQQVAQPSGADPVDGGHVQPSTPTKSQLNAFGPNAGVG